MNILSFLIIFSLMLIGAVAHWAKKKMRKEVSGNIVDYFFADYPGRSVSVIGVLLASASAAATSEASTIIDPFMLWHEIVTNYTIPSISWLAIGGALTWGWTFDSGINKGAQ